MIDFDALVLNPATNIFAIAATFTCPVSQPGVPPFVLRGVFSSTPLNIEMQDGTVYSDQQTSLGIRIAEFAAYPTEGDFVTITEPTHWAFGKEYWIGDIDFDGQGGGMLLLRSKEPPS
jgi:hypothetical protein